MLLVFSVSVAQKSAPTFTEKAKAATAILFSQNENGGMVVRCTATAFDKHGDKYTFVSAAHCVGEDDVQHERVATSNRTTFYISFDESKLKRFYNAKVLWVGYQHRGDDFSIYEVDPGKDVDWPVIPIGDEKKEQEGNSVLNIASPQGLGLQVFHGSISKMELDRPVVEGDINWKGAILLQMPGTNGGSSGSAIISEKQEKIVAFLVGTIGGTSITAIPASRFSTFKDKAENGKYKWIVKNDDDEQ
jgi:hypothetical protein